MTSRAYTLTLFILLIFILASIASLLWVVRDEMGVKTAVFSPPHPLPTTQPLAHLTTPTPPLPTPLSATPTSTPHPTLHTLRPTNTATPHTPHSTPTAPLPTLTPVQPQPYLSQYGLVAFYGSPTGPGLGILGSLPREQMHQQLLTTVADFIPLMPGRTVLPTYHMIVTVATQNPPYYHSNVDLALIEEWVQAAEERETAVILDIQPSHGDIIQQVNRIRHLLYHPHVHLALDPEYAMQPGQVPLVNIGSLYANTINAIQADLNQIAQEIGHNRVLILHQFTDSMLPDKANIQLFPHVEIVIDGDGVGSAAAKIRNYTQYTTEPAFHYGGFKLYPRDGDVPLLTPAEIMNQLSPPPVLVIYQ